METRIRRLAAREGYYIRKSRRALGLENKGEFMLLNTSTNLPALGWHYDATLKEIEEWLRGHLPGGSRLNKEEATRFFNRLARAQQRATRF